MSQNASFRLSVFGDEVTPDFDDQVASAQRQGVDNLEVRTSAGQNIAEMPAEELRRMAQVLEANGMGVSAIGSPVGKAAVTGDFDIELERFRACAEAANILGTRLIRVFSYFIPDGKYAEYRDEVLRRMSALAAEAAKRDLLLVHENESYVYGDVPERCLDLIESVGSSALMVCFDPANFLQVGAKPYDDGWRLLSPYVRHFHVKDAVPVDRSGIEPYPVRAPEGRLMASVRPAGLGDADVKQLLTALSATDYDGFLTLEPHLRWYLPDADGDECFKVATDQLRALLEEIR